MISFPPGPHLLDTSAVLIMRRQGIVANANALFSFATLGELSTGIHRASDSSQEAARIRRVLGSATVLLATIQTARIFGQITAALQAVGQPIPVNDVWNAALAMEHTVPLLAKDVHFARVPGLTFLPIP